MTRRRTIWLAVPLLFTVAVLGGCAGAPDAKGVASAGGGATASAAPAPADDAEQGRRFAVCMRAEGVDMPDPDENGRIAMRAERAGKPGDKPGGAAADTAQKAMEKCRELLPNGGEPPEMKPEDIEKMRAYARCVRENGYPAFPDPDPATGALQLEAESNADGEKMRKAAEKCEDVGPDAMPAVVGVRP
jgi:hypothetical protein